MKNFEYAILCRLVEFMPAIALWDSYGSAHNLAEAIHFFVSQGEVTRIGTITCCVLIGGHIASYARKVAAWIWHFFDPGSPS